MAEENTVVESTEEEQVVEVVATPLEELDFTGIAFNTEVDGETALSTIENKNFYVEKAKEAGLTKNTLELVQAFDEKFMAGVVAASEENSEKIFKDNKGVEVIEAVVPFGVHYNVGDKDMNGRKLGTNTAKAVNSLLTTKISREVTYPGDVKKPAIKVVVTSPRYKMGRTSVRKLEDKLKEALAK